MWAERNHGSDGFGQASLRRDWQFATDSSLRRAIAEFIEHYHHERNHQGLNNLLILPLAAETAGDGSIVLIEHEPTDRFADRESRFKASAG